MSFDNTNLNIAKENKGLKEIFNRNEMDASLYELAKECRKISKHAEFEIILVGGASVVLNYNFRDTTSDFDAILRGSKDTFKEAIKKVADSKGYKLDWINDHFKSTSSFNEKIVEYSKFYKKFANCLYVRTVDAEYLAAMKIESARKYKHDISDLVGIIKEQIERDKPISYEQVAEAYKNLYGNDMKLSEELNDEIKKIFSADDYEELYYATYEMEKRNSEALKIAMQEYKDYINEGNVIQFISAMKEKKSNQISQNEESKQEIENNTAMSMSSWRNAVSSPAPGVGQTGRENVGDKVIDQTDRDDI